MRASLLSLQVGFLPQLTGRENETLSGMLLDEVLGRGDAGFYAKSAAAIRERIRSDRACVLVSHDLAAMADLCDRCVWIERGRVNAIGAPADVLASYTDAIHTARV